MGDSFFEETVPKKTSFGTVLLKLLLIVLTAVTLIFGLFASFLFMLAFVALALIDHFVFPRFKVEYEYSYVNGEIDVAAIYSKQNRKHLVTITGENLECVAPLGSDALRGYGDTFPIKDYSGDMGGTPSVIVKGGTEHAKYYLMLTEEMLRDLKYRYPGKVILDM